MRQALGLLASLMLLLPLVGCGESHSWRQKTILEVQTPNGVVSGGSVVEVSVRWFGQLESDLSQGHGASNESRGEASFVEVAPRKYLFALSVNEPFGRTYETMRNADDAKGGENPAKVLTRRLETSHESRLVPLGKYPTLVTFDDINDPTSVRQVDPADLAASFGPGYSLKSITLEITDEKVTQGVVEKVLGWLYDPQYRNNPIWASLPLLAQNAISGMKQPLSANDLELRK